MVTPDGSDFRSFKSINFYKKLLEKQHSLKKSNNIKSFIYILTFLKFDIYLEKEMVFWTEHDLFKPWPLACYGVFIKT